MTISCKLGPTIIYKPDPDPTKTPRSGSTTLYASINYDIHNAMGPKCLYLKKYLDQNGEVLENPTSFFYQDHCSGN